MEYIILDLEWNQCPAGRPMYKGALTFEIIEFGAVKISEDGQELGRFHSYVYPKVYKRMHYMTKEVTGIDIRVLKEQGKPFVEVMHSFLDWCGENYKFCIWGEMDLTELQNNCEYYKMKDIFPKPLFYIDVQKLFSMQYEDGKARKNLKAAVEYLNIPEPEGQQFHSAYSDALYTAEIFKTLDMNKLGKYLSVDYHQIPNNRDEEVYLDFDTYSKYISREFVNKEDAMKDKIVSSSVCYKCGKPLRKKIKWFSVNGKQFYSAAYCPEHGWLKGKVRVKRGQKGGVFIVKTQKLVDKQIIEEIKEKQNELRTKRRMKKVPKPEE